MFPEPPVPLRLPRTTSPVLPCLGWVCSVLCANIHSQQKKRLSMQCLSSSRDPWQLHSFGRIFFFKYKWFKSGAGEMAQLVKGLLHKQEALSSISSTKQGTAVCAREPSMREVGLTVSQLKPQNKVAGS